MKSITLCRHGKSSWEYNVSDRERPLKTRGENDAELVANQFIRQSNLPEKIFSSPAKRAFETCRIFCNTVGYELDDVELVEELYDFGGENVVNFLKNLPDLFSDIMIFGHNHAFTSICNIFGNHYIDNLPTSGLMKINFDIDHWKQLKQGTTEIVIIPKELKHD